MKKKYSLILLSGGVGRRMNNNVPKQYMLLAGKPVIMHILERIDRVDEIDEIIIVCAQEYISSIELMVSQYDITTPVVFANAGDTRQMSVYSGLQQAKNDDVVIHEAARPFVKASDFENLINEPSNNVMYGLDIPFTVLKGHEIVEGCLDRSELVNVQLPQKFTTNLLKQAHENAQREHKVFTEDASMIHSYFPDENIKIIKGMEYNIKLTTRMDVLVGDIIYKEIFSNRK